MEKQDIESMLYQPTRIKWACRRGMLELDVLLNNFLKNGYNKLDDKQKYLFVEMLIMPDPELFALLMERVSPPTQAMGELIKRVREHARG